MILALAAVLAHLVAPRAGKGLGAPNIAAKFQPPRAAYWLGTDHLGRDMLSRAIFGARVSLTKGVLIVAVSLPISLPFGLRAGYFGG